MTRIHVTTDEYRRHEDKITLLDTLALAFKWEIPASQSIRAAFSEGEAKGYLPDGTTQKALESLKSGASLESIFDDLGGFSEFDLFLIKAGWESGRVEVAFTDLANYLRGYKITHVIN